MFNGFFWWDVTYKYLSFHFVVVSIESSTHILSDIFPFKIPADAKCNAKPQLKF